jgi:integrase
LGNCHRVARRYYGLRIASALMRGTGRLYLRGEIWWFQISYAGRKLRVSTGLRGGREGHPPPEVEMWKARKLAELGRGNVSALRSDSLLVDTILDSLETRYRSEARTSLPNALNRVKRLRAYFAGWRVQNLTPSAILAFEVKRRDVEHAAVTTINLEAALLRRALYIAWEDGLIPSVPKVPRLPGGHIRQGFLDEHQFRHVLSYIADKYKAPLEFLWLTGWRLNECLKLRWDKVSWDSRELLLETSKNGEPRSLPFSTYPELERVLERQYKVSPFGQVFPVPRKGLQRAWELARTKAGTKALIHDLRRSFVRRCERAGIQRSVAMAVTGHKTEAVYKRYAVICRRDVEEGLAKLARSGEPPVVEKIG